MAKLVTGSILNIGPIGSEVKELETTGAIKAASKYGDPTNSFVSKINITYEDQGYIPYIFLQWVETGDCDVAYYVSYDISAITATITLLDNRNTSKNGQLRILLLQPDVE